MISSTELHTVNVFWLYATASESMFLLSDATNASSSWKQNNAGVGQDLAGEGLSDEFTRQMFQISVLPLFHAKWHPCLQLSMSFRQHNLNSSDETQSCFSDMQMELVRRFCLIATTTLNDYQCMAGDSKRTITPGQADPALCYHHLSTFTRTGSAAPRGSALSPVLG